MQQCFKKSTEFNQVSTKACYLICTNLLFIFGETDYNYNMIEAIHFHKLPNLMIKVSYFV